MEKNRVHNLIIVDASGSMSSIYDQALAGIKETMTTIYLISNHDPYIDQYVTLLSFANGGEPLEYIYKDVDIELTQPVTKKDYQLRGATALYDAIGESVTELRRSVRSGEKALVTIITDGMENDSQHWSGKAVRSLIEELKHEGWVFTYIGANQDVEEEGRKMGVTNTLKFEASIEGTVKMFKDEGRYRQRWNERVRRGEKDVQEGYFREEDTLDEMPDRVTPERIDRLAHNEVFVFGSNAQGRHDGGAARAACQRFGAQYGVGEGPQGQSYAIPTTGCYASHTEHAIVRFIEYARQHTEQRFLVTAIGCGHGGWRVPDMARLWTDASTVENICLPQIFWNFSLFSHKTSKKHK